MKVIKLVIAAVAILIPAFVVYFVLKSDSALLAHPKGIIARSELNLITTNILLMLIVAVPMFILLFTIAWKYRAQNSSAKYEPEHTGSLYKELILWMIPSVVIAVMAVIMLHATYKLDPYQPIKSKVKPLTIQVVALDWKWLFIYPEQGIAAVNFVQFPSRTPIRFELVADGSPMNSFWIPELGGQIYVMSGMMTPLHLMADGIGEYPGRAAEINGRGFSDMTFVAKSTSQSDFDDWVVHVKQSSFELTYQVYDALLQPSTNNPIVFYSFVEADLFNKIVMKYSHPATP